MGTVSNGAIEYNETFNYLVDNDDGQVTLETIVERAKKMMSKKNFSDAEIFLDALLAAFDLVDEYSGCIPDAATVEYERVAAKD